MKQSTLILCLAGLLGLSGGIPEVLYIAMRYLGTSYVAGTLECEDGEYLIVNEQGVDCTTFVELSVARWLTIENDSFTFEQQVQALRYRDGVIDGYLSRLHYFTDWVAENTRRGIWYELKPEESGIWYHDTLTLGFMSAHPQSYPHLKEDAWAVDSMRKLEARYAHYPISYIKKEALNLPPDKLPIRNGDILALVTNIEGLDVTHLGFAIWKKDKLHLMHASMKHGEVVIDERTLYEYLKNRHGCPGIRVVRLKSEK